MNEVRTSSDMLIIIFNGQGMFSDLELLFIISSFEQTSVGLMFNV